MNKQPCPLVSYSDVKRKARPLLRLPLPQGHSQGVHFVDLMESHCSVADCDCRRVGLFVPRMGLDHDTAQAWISQCHSLRLEFEMDSGRLTVCDGDQPLVGWLRESLPAVLQEKGCLNKVRKRSADVRQWKNPDAWQQFDWSSLERGGLLAYREVRPAAPPLVFGDGEERFSLQDHYCWTPDCDCTEMVVALVWLDKSQILGGLRYDYAHQKVLTVDQSRIPESQLRALMQTAMQSIPDLNALVKERGRFMTQEFGSYVHQRFFPPVLSAPQGKAGRNDPCPCGSGKKHKKCCLA